MLEILYDVAKHSYLPWLSSKVASINLLTQRKGFNNSASVISVIEDIAVYWVTVLLVYQNIQKGDIAEWVLVT